MDFAAAIERQEVPKHMARRGSPME